MNAVGAKKLIWSESWAEFEKNWELYRRKEYRREFSPWSAYFVDTTISHLVRIPIIDERFWSEASALMVENAGNCGRILKSIKKDIDNFVNTYSCSKEDFFKIIDLVESNLWKTLIDLKKNLQDLAVPNWKHLMVIVMLMLWRKWYNNISSTTASDIARSAWDEIAAAIQSTPNSTVSDLDIYDLQQWDHHWVVTPSSLQDISDYDPSIDKSIELDISPTETAKLIWDTLSNSLSASPLLKNNSYSSQIHTNLLSKRNLILEDIELDRTTDLWRYLNTKKREAYIHDACANSKYFSDHQDAFAALIMTEGYGDQFVFNESDGGGGMCQIQPDVAVKDLGMTIFTSHPKYKSFDVYVLLNKKHSSLDTQTKSLIKKLYTQEKEPIPKKWTKKRIYRLHWLLLKYILHTEGEDFLEQTDERFQPKLAIQWAMKHLVWTYKQAEWDSRWYLQWPWRDERVEFFADLWVSMDHAFAINGYNKWHTKYGDNILPKWFGTSGSKNHMANWYHNFETYRFFDEQIWKSNLTWAELIAHLKTLKVDHKIYTRYSK